MGNSDAGLAVATTRWNQTIDRALVHRDSIAEVLLTDIVQLGESEFSVAAQWPRSHRVYRPDAVGRHDPMLVLETIRQTGLALSHAGFGVTRQHHSVMRDISFGLDPTLEPRAVRSATNLSIAVRCTDVIRRAEQLRGMTVQLSFAADGFVFAQGSGTIRWVSSPAYRALRARGGGPTSFGSAPVERPVATANRAFDDALLAPTLGNRTQRQLLVPIGHPVYFDHALDHAPGMLLIDAVWQATVDLLGPDVRLIGCEMRCPAFTELGPGIEISLTAVHSDSVLFEVRQDDRMTASGLLRLAG